VNNHYQAMAVAFLMAGVMLGGCNRDQPGAPARPGQALASVNGAEITVLQLNEEMQRAGVPAAQHEHASKQLLQALIDRTLLESEAAKRNLDRDPKVMQAIARARSLIIAQAYMQQRVGDAGRPSQADVEAYFNQHPQFFAKRRQFAMDQLIMPASAVTPALRATFDRSTSLDDVAQFLDARQIGYGRAQVTRSTADLKPEVAAKLSSMPKGQLFFVQEGPRALLTALTEVRDAPVSLAIAAPQITQFLANRKNKELAQAEIARLRATAQIAYLNKDLAPDASSRGSRPATAAASLAGGAGAGAEAATAGSDTREGNADKEALERGVAGLR
jgi:peptidyl-prolyl cis-trans isomerase C